MSGFNTTWKIGKRVIRLKDVIRYLNKKRRRVHFVSAQSLYRVLGRRLKINRKRMMRADMDIPIIVVLNRETKRPIVVLDGNHRLAKAVALGLDIGIRTMYDDEYNYFFGV